MKSLLRGTGARGNLIFAFAAQSSTVLVNLFLSLAVARRLSVEDFSYWQLFTFYNAFAGLAPLGLEQGVYLRYAGLTLPRLNAPLLGGQFRLLAVYLLLCGGAVAGLSSVFVSDENRRAVLLATAVYLALIGMTGFWGCLFQAVNHTRLYSACTLLTRLSFLLLAGGTLVAGIRRFGPFLVCWLCAQGLGLLFCLAAARRAAVARGAPLRAVGAELVKNCKAGLPLLLATVAGGLLPGSARLVADCTFGIAVFGQFSFALALAGLLGQSVGQVGMVLFPALKHGRPQGLAPAYRQIDLVLHLFLPLPLLAYAPARALLTLWLPRYAQSFAWLALLLPLCLFDGKMQILYGTYLKIRRRERALLAVNAVGFGTALAFSLLAAALGGGVAGIALGLVAASALRSLLGRLCTAGQAGATAYPGLAHLLLAAIFMASAWFLPPVPGFLVYLSAYTLFWLMQRSQWWVLAALWRDKKWTGSNRF